MRTLYDLKTGLALYMNQMGFKSVRDMAGLGLGAVEASTDSIERDTVIYPKFLKDKCTGCGRCNCSRKKTSIWII